MNDLLILKGAASAHDTTKERRIGGGSIPFAECSRRGLRDITERRRVQNRLSTFTWMNSRVIVGWVMPEGVTSDEGQVQCF
jgi:hypothetical protein